MMKLLKKGMLFLLAMSLMPCADSFAQPQTEAVAQYTFAASPERAHLAAEMADNSEPAIVERDGRQGWQLSNTQGTTESATIVCNLESSFAHDVSDGSTYEIEIDYYDADRAVFSLVYSAQDRSDRFAGSITTGGVGSKEVLGDVKMWRTAVFRIQDAKFDDSCYGGDFCISVNILNSNHGITASTPNGYGPDNGYGPNYSSYYIDTYGRVSTLDPVVIGAVRVKKLAEKNPFAVQVTMDSTSNTLFDEEPAVFHYQMENRFAQGYDLQADYTVTDEDGRVVLTKSETVSIGASEETKAFTVDLGQVPYGLFRLQSVFTSDGVRNETVTEFSHSREAVVANPRVGTNVHFEGSNMYKNDQPKMVELIQKAGISSIRDSARWRMFEPSKGQYVVPEMVQEGMDLAQQAGLDSLPIVSDANTAVYGEDSDPPVTDEDLEGFRQFAKFVAETYRGKAEAVESYNEYNIHHPTNTPEEFVKLMKATYEGVKEAAPEMKVIGIDSAGLSLRDMREIFDAGGLGYMDGVSYHPYYHSRGPESSGVISNGLAVRELLKEYGREDAEIWITENGWPTWLGNPITESDQAVFHVTTILENAAWQLFDKYYFYEFSNSGIQPEYMESFFGMVRSVYDEVPYSARPAYVGVCNANYQLGGTEFVDALGGLSTTANDFVYRFKRDNSDGKGEYLIAVWTISDRSEIGMNLGTESARMYDFYGNESELYSIDGKFSIAACDKPVYLVGDFLSFEACEAPISTNGLVLNGASNDTVKQTIQMPGGDGAVIVPEGSTFFAAEDRTAFIGDQAIYTVQTPPERFFNQCAQYRIEKEGKIYYHGNIKIESAETVTVKVDHVTNGEDVNHWKLMVDVTNNRNSTAVDGYILIRQPEAFSSVMPRLSISGLQPQQTQTYELFLPEIVTKEMRDFRMEVGLSTGETLDISEKMFFTVVPYAGFQAPVIDGQISPGEYSDETWLDISGGANGENVKLLDSATFYKGENDLSAKANMKYDKDHLYLFIEVTDDVFCNNNSDSMSWSGDSIQLGIADASVVSGSNYCELTIALTPNGPEVYRNLTNNAKSIGMVDRIELQIVREGNKTKYEMALPWTEVLTEPALATAGYRPKFAILINEDDGLGRNSYLEYSQVLGAIGTDKNVLYFSDLYLMD